MKISDISPKCLSPNDPHPQLWEWKAFFGSKLPDIHPMIFFFLWQLHIQIRHMSGDGVPREDVILGKYLFSYWFHLVTSIFLHFSHLYKAYTANLTSVAMQYILPLQYSCSEIFRLLFHTGISIFLRFYMENLWGTISNMKFLAWNFKEAGRHQCRFQRKEDWTLLIIS